MDECPGLFLEHSGGIAGKMWHEARKQERKIREVMINYQKRAERRREHYEKMRVNPNQFLRLYGSKCQMHIDPSGGNRDSTMIPWQGDSSNMISRYDVRIHLDYIPDDSKLPKHELTAEEKKEEAKCNYERYRSLVQHSFRGLGEKEALAQIDVEEMYPDNRKKGKEKKKSQAKAAIAYSYQEEEEEAVDEEEQARRDEELLAAYLGEEVEEEKAFSSESEYEIDMDVDELGTSQVDKLNVLALDFGVPAGAFSRTLRTEKAQLEEQKQARLADLEKSTLSGKKARRERRLLKEKRVNPRMPTPPTYARRGSPTYEPYEGEGEPRSGSSSRSPSPEVGRVEYITEFGGGSSDPPNKKEPTSLKETKPRIPQHPSPSHSHSSHPHQHSYHRRPRSRSRSRDRSHHHHRHSERSRSRSRSRSRGRSRERRHRRRSSSRSRERYHYSRRSRSRSHSPKPHTHRSRSHSRSRSRSHSPHEKRNSSSEKNKPSSAPATTPRASKPKEKPKLTPQERLKKKMQAQLSKQFKQDKKVQREKEEQKEAQRVEREEELRDQMMRLREKEKSQWEKEHEERELHRRHSRSRSRSPHGYHYSSHDYYSY